MTTIFDDDWVATLHLAVDAARAHLSPGRHSGGATTAMLGTTAAGAAMELDRNVGDSSAMRRVFGHYPSGVAAIAATVDGAATVLVSSSFMVGISMDPPLVTFAVQHTSQSWPTLSKAARFGVSVLSADQAGLCRQLSSKDRENRFNGVGTNADGEAILLADAAAWLICTLYGVQRAGDHDIVILEVVATATDHNRDPLVFHGSAFRPLANEREPDGEHDDPARFAQRVARRRRRQLHPPARRREPAHPE